MKKMRKKSRRARQYLHDCAPKKIRSYFTTSWTIRYEVGNSYVAPFREKSIFTAAYRWESFEIKRIIIERAQISNGEELQLVFFGAIWFKFNGSLKRTNQIQSIRQRKSTNNDFISFLPSTLLDISAKILSPLFWRWYVLCRKVIIWTISNVDDETKSLICPSSLDVISYCIRIRIVSFPILKVGT